MSPLDTPLNDQELDMLDSFLLARIPEEEDEVNVDEGILDISELDGFFTALVSGPEVLQPSQWLPVVWGAFEPQWESQEKSEAMVSLMLRHMNGIVNTLTNMPNEFEPIVLAREEAGESVTVVDEWCVGYMKGVGLAAQGWRLGGSDLMELMFPITLFSSGAGREQLAQLEAEEVEVLKRSLPNTAQKIHAFWQKRRQSPTTFMHETQPVGRNDLCPCGSGKKFKKCCLH